MAAANLGADAMPGLDPGIQGAGQITGVT